MGKQPKGTPKAKATAAKSMAGKPNEEVPEDYDADETESLKSATGSTASSLESGAVHKKRKALLGQLKTVNKDDTEVMQVWKQRKLEEYQAASKMTKNQILSDWISNDSRLKQWHSNVTKTREEQQVWKEKQKEGWMKPSMIAELNKLKPDKSDGDQERLEFLLEQLQRRPCPTFGEKFGDLEYFYHHMDEIFDYENNISSASKVRSNCDIKGKLVDPQLQGSGIVLNSMEKVKGIKMENPVLDALKKEIQKAKKLEGTGLALLPSLVILKRQLTDQGQKLCDQAEKNFLLEAEILAEIYDKAEKMLKDEQEMDHQAMKCQITYGMSTFNDKISGLKNLRSELKDMFSVKASNQG